ncbi:MAG TPA: hypothetical protein VJ647_03690 [Chitinophagaceae bacterium]|nr:hypothetical protein [Chitinophagaceae bacterium]
MHLDKNLHILELLANGINPINNEPFPTDHPCQHPEVIRALFNVITMVKKEKPHFPPPAPRKTINPGDPAKKGVPWTKEEDRNLIDSFKENPSLEQLAKQHERSHFAIEKRLMKLGLIPAKYTPDVNDLNPVPAEAVSVPV